MTLVVNLEEFSELCGVTTETMRGYIRQIDDAPGWLIERGDRGRGYKIEAEGGVAWWRAKRADDERMEADRLEQLSLLRSDLLGDQADSESDLFLSGKQRREEYAAAMDRIKLRRTMGELVEISEIEGPLAHASVELRRRMGQVVDEFRVAVDLPEDQSAQLRDMVERAMADWVEVAGRVGQMPDA